MKYGGLHKVSMCVQIGALMIGFTVNSGAAQEQSITLAVRHDHFWGSCNGTFVMDGRGVRYITEHEKDARTWNYEDIREFQVGADRRIRLLTYEDRSIWRFGADRVFEFAWADDAVAGEQVYQFLASRTARPIAAALAPTEVGTVSFDLPAKHLGVLKGDQGRLLFAADVVVFRTENAGSNRTWRYTDLESISSAGPYDLTLTTYEQKRFHYASRRVYNFQLKQPLSRDAYNSLWRFVNQREQASLPK
jgi:hypothetical protein